MEPSVPHGVKPRSSYRFFKFCSYRIDSSSQLMPVSHTAISLKNRFRQGRRKTLSVWRPVQIVRIAAGRGQPLVVLLHVGWYVPLNSIFLLQRNRVSATLLLNGACICVALLVLDPLEIRDVKKCCFAAFIDAVTYIGCTSNGKRLTAHLYDVMRFARTTCLYLQVASFFFFLLTFAAAFVLYCSRWFQLFRVFEFGYFKLQTAL